MLPVHVSRSAPLMMALALAFPALLHAASATDLPDIRHEVRAGDTLEGVAKKYLKDPQQWREVGRINQVPNPTRLPIGSVIVIPASMVGYQNVTVEHVQGAAQLRSVLDTARTAARSMRIIRENLGWATLYNLTAIPAAALGFLNPWLSGVGMAASSAVVIANALRLRKA